MKTKILVALAASLLAMPMAVNAATIVNTGMMPGPVYYSYDGNSYRGGQFTLTSGWVITDIQYFFYDLTAGGATFTLRADASGLPGAILQSVEMQIPFTSSAQWQGPSGLNWSVGPDTYWVTIEARVGSGTPAGLFRAPIAFESYAPWPYQGFTPMSEDARSTDGSTWELTCSGIPCNPTNAGWRIYGTQSAVPLPAALWLLLSGLAGLGVLRRRKTN